MKLSVSLSEADVEYLDEYASTHQLSSPSAAVQRAVRMLRAWELARESKAQAEQVRSISVGRLGPRMGRVAPDRLAELDEALRLHFAL